MNKWQAQLDRCTGPAPKQFVRPRPLTGIERELRDLEAKKLEKISSEYEREFGGKR